MVLSACGEVGHSDEGLDDGRFVAGRDAGDGVGEGAGGRVRVGEQIVVDAAGDDRVAELARGMEVERRIRQVEETEESAEGEEEDQEGEARREVGRDAG